MNLTPHITPGRRLIKIPQIDYDNPTHLILGIKVIRNPRYKTYSAVSPVTIAMENLNNFRYNKVRDTAQTIKEHLTHGITWDDAEPEHGSTVIDQSGDDAFLRTLNEWPEWDESERSESRPTQSDPNYSEWM